LAFFANSSGHPGISQTSVSFLLQLHHLPEQPEQLRELTIPLMTTLIGCPDLCVMQTEFSVYVLLRLWVFLLFHPTWQGNPQVSILPIPFGPKQFSDCIFYLGIVDKVFF
jgi:hypothetical protein